MSIIEEWRPVAGYEGFYEVSNQGRVRSVERLVPNGKGGHKRMKARYMTPNGRNSQRYLFITLCRDAKPKHCTVHRLVLEAFVGPCPSGMEALHGDGGPYDSKLSNLRWGTRIENSQDKWEQGSMPHGEAHHKTTLDRLQVIAIRKDDRSLAKIAKEFNVSKSCVCAIKTRRTWAWLN